MVGGCAIEDLKLKLLDPPDEVMSDVTVYILSYYFQGVKGAF